MSPFWSWLLLLVVLVPVEVAALKFAKRLADRDRMDQRLERRWLEDYRG